MGRSKTVLACLLGAEALRSPTSYFLSQSLESLQQHYFGRFFMYALVFMYASGKHAHLVVPPP